MEQLIEIIESPVSETVLEETHEDHTAITTEQVRELLETVLLQKHKDILDLKIETVDRNYSTAKEIVSGDATIRPTVDSTSVRVQYEINVSGSYSNPETEYDHVEVAILPK